MKLEINNREKNNVGNSQTCGKGVIYSFLNNKWVKEETKREIRKNFVINGNEDKMNKNMNCN